MTRRGRARRLREQTISALVRPLPSTAVLGGRGQGEDIPVTAGRTCLAVLVLTECRDKRVKYSLGKEWINETIL